MQNADFHSTKLAAQKSTQKYAYESRPIFNHGNFYAQIRLR